MYIFIYMCKKDNRKSQYLNEPSHDKTMEEALEKWTQPTSQAVTKPWKRRGKS